MAELNAEKRHELKDNDFAYIDKQGNRHLPIEDESHVRNAISRWNQTDFESASAKEAARRKIVAAAKSHGVEIDEDDKIRKAAE